MMSSLSHSAVTTWRECPRQWKLQKLDHVTQAPAGPLIFGDAIHQALAADGLACLAGDARLDRDELMDHFLAALDERLRRDDPNDYYFAGEYQTWIDSARAIFAGYIEHVQPFYQPLAVETWFGRDPEIPIPDADGWSFVGILDARVYVPGRGYGLVDWKTGKPWDIGKEHGDGQASAYLFADEARDIISDHRGAPPASFVMFLLLPVVDGVCLPEQRITTRTHADRFAYVEYLRTITREIDEAKRTGDFKANTTGRCVNCSVLGSCEAGRHYLYNGHRESRVPGVTITHEPGWEAK